MIKIPSPACILISGPSQSGKTSFIAKIIQNKDKVFEKTPSSILYVYNTWNKNLDAIKNDKTVTFTSELPTEDVLEKYFASSSHSAIFFDDQMLNSLGKAVIESFTVKANNTNTTCFFVTQNLFAKGIRNISLNSHVICLFNSPRDITQISRLASQLGRKELIISAYKDACKRNHGYLLINIHPSSDCKYMVFSGLFPEDETIVYQE